MDAGARCGKLLALLERESMSPPLTICPRNDVSTAHHQAAVFENAGVDVNAGVVTSCG